MRNLKRRMIRVMTRGRTLPLAALLIFASSLVQVAAGPKLLATTHVQRTIEEVLCRLTDVREIEHLRLTESTERLRFDLRLTPEGQRVEYIRSVYLDVLGRDPMGKDCAGMRSWVEGGLTPEAVRRGIEAAPEGRRVAEVRRAFQEVLGRDPLDADNAALRYWVETSANADLIKEVLRTMRPQVGVYYFPWYAPSAAGWGNGSTVVPAGAPKPLLGWYSSNDADVLNVQIDQMERAGFDFVILDVPVGQSAIWENAKTFFEALRGRKLKAAVMLDDLYASPPAVKAEWVRQVILEFGNHPNYFYLPDGALIPLYSSPLDFSYPHVALRTVYWTARYGQGENTFNEQGFLHPRDWPFWAAPDTPLLNGLVPVTPGYDDGHLGRQRPMSQARDGGKLYISQWEQALAQHPQIITVYSWNENFEQTAIEPTDTWDDRYLKLTACFIERAKSGNATPCT